MKLATHVLIALGLCLLSANTLVLGQQCRSQNPDEYERDNYVVQTVLIESDNAIFNRAVPDVAGLIAQLPTKAGKSFSKADLKTSKDTIVGNSNYIDEPVIYVPAVDSVFQNCTVNAGTKQVQIVFQVLYFVTPLKTTPGPKTYERFQPQTTPRTARTPARKLPAIFQLQPFVGFTGSENLAGAGVNVATKKPIAERLSAQGGGSKSGALGSASLEGDRLFKSSFLRTLRWRGGYEYSKLASEDDLDLKKGTGFLQFFAASKAFGKQDFVLRYGASVEGGNRQTNLEDISIPSDEVASSGYKSIKTYVGASWRFGVHQFKASYGLQLGGTDGQSAANNQVDFLKHIFDSAYKVRFYPGGKPLSLEAQFTAGRIGRRGVLPVAEEFFGGNIDENFIAGSDWGIRSAPFIRSFSGRRLTVNDSLLPVGGERFESFNLTLSATLWSKPAIPREALEQLPVAFDILENHPKADIIRNALTTMFTTETKSYEVEIATVDSNGMEAALLSLQRFLNSIPANSVTPETRELLDTCLTDIEASLTIVAAFKKKIVFENGKFVTTNLDARPELTELVIASLNEDSGAKQDGYLLVIANKLAALIALRDPGLDPFLTDLRAQQTSMQGFFESTKKKFENFERDGLPIAKTNMMNLLRDLRVQIETLGRELNIFSVGPVFMFDAARLNTDNQRNGFRYGVGTGLAVEVFGLQFSGGYSWNPNRRLGEPRGAVVFGLNVADWLR